MSKKTFEIEWCDDYGEEWLNKHNLESCLFSDTHITNVQVDVRDITCYCGISTYSKWDKDEGKFIKHCESCDKILL